MKSSLLIPVLSTVLPIASAYTFREATDVLCGYGDSCWPSSLEWKVLNLTSGGNVFAVQPLAAVCHGNTFNQAACACDEATQNWSIGAYTAEFRGGYPAHAYSDGFGTDSCRVDTPKTAACGQGRVPPMMLQASCVYHVQLGINFARLYKLRLRIKSTGHSLTGGASAFGAFAIDVHNMKDIEFTNNFKLAGAGTSKGSAVIVGPGVQFYELYEAADKAGVTVVGGGCDSVSVSGYTLGGGHSRYSPHYGLAVDNLLQVQIVTPDGRVQYANEKVNTEIFYAVRGGGAGWGVVTEWVFQTHPPVQNEVINNFQIVAPSQALYRDAVYQYLSLMPTLRDNGWSDLAIGQQAAGLIIGATFKPNHTDIATEDQVFKPLYDWASANGVVFVTNYTSYPSQYSLTSSEQFANQHVVDFDLLAYNSRLIPRTTFSNTATLSAVADFIAALPSLNFIGVAGGAVANSHAPSMALNPAWRTALSHILWETRWAAGSTKDQQAVARAAGVAQLNNFTNILGSNAAYVNEAATDDDAWPTNYWGSQYSKILALKKKYDPSHLFNCNNCVGSETPGGKW
ncbi:FAD-binding domain-containing protein [Atractiella rhizophila]|nr:FAD-binding domain-containing protein [Atractiella rhizophila]